MSAVAFFGALEIGLIYGVVALGVYLTFRSLDFPDLTVEGTFPMGGAVAAAGIVAGINPWTATVLAFVVGGGAGLVTAFLAVKCGVLHLLAGILVMFAAFSVNIRIMGKPNISLLGEPTVFSPLDDWGLDPVYARPILCGLAAVLLLAFLTRFLLSEFGLATRATGANPRMTRAQGGSPGFHVFCGLALSNGLVALGGALFAQSGGFADVTSGVGTIVVGLAAVILGETLFRSRRIWIILLSCAVGSVIYRLAVALALSSGIFGLRASDLNLVTAALVALALVAPKMRTLFSARTIGKIGTEKFGPKKTGGVGE